jgi:hypothetical protein
MKYYWISGLYKSSIGDDWQPEEFVATNHPFRVQNMRMEDKDNYDYQLSNWKEITKEEYEMYKKFFE